MSRDECKGYHCCDRKLSKSDVLVAGLLCRSVEKNTELHLTGEFMVGKLCLNDTIKYSHGTYIVAQ